MDLGVLKALRLRDGAPDLGQILNQRVAEILERRVSYMVADNEEEERSCGGPRSMLTNFRLAWHPGLSEARTACPSRRAAD